MKRNTSGNDGISQKHGGNVRADKPTRKPKNDEGIRLRKWKAPDGSMREAYQADAGIVNGKRTMRSFPTKADAQNWLRSTKLAVKDQGQAALTLSDKQRVDAVRAMEALRAGECPVTIEDAVKEYVAVKALLGGAVSIGEAVKSYMATRSILEGTATPEAAAKYYREHKAPVIRRTVAQVVDEHLQDARDRNVRPMTMRDLEHRMGLFRVAYGDKLITEITREDCDKWIRDRADKWRKVHHLEMTNTTKKNYRVLGGGLFNFAISRDYVTENPFAQKLRTRHHADEKMPECLTWQDVKALLNTAAKVEPSMVAPLAIGCFAGLRTAEIRGMDWKHVNLAAKRITVDSSVAKKRRTRYVAMTDNLVAWLLPHRQESGLVAPKGQAWRFRFDRVRELAKIQWPANSMRHTFASHHLAMYGDPARTAFELGHHRDTSMLFDHYRALVTKENAEHYWKITPEAVPGVEQIPVQQVG